jgi:hypothetical protein
LVPGLLQGKDWKYYIEDEKVKKEENCQVDFGLLVFEHWPFAKRIDQVIDYSVLTVELADNCCQFIAFYDFKIVVNIDPHTISMSLFFHLTDS